MRSTKLLLAALLLLPMVALAAEAPTPLTAQGTKVVKAKEQPRCEAPTGSRIRPSEKTGCDKKPDPFLTSYSQDDLLKTGQIDINQALRRLDPRFN